MFKKTLLFLISTFVLCGGYVSAEETQIASLGNVIGITKMNNSNTGYIATLNGIYNIKGELMTQVSQGTEYWGKIGTPYVDVYITNSRTVNGMRWYRTDCLNIVDKQTGQVLGTPCGGGGYRTGGPAYSYYLDEDYLTISIIQPNDNGEFSVKISLNDNTVEGVARPTNLRGLPGTNFECNKGEDSSYCFYKNAEGIKYTKNDNTTYNVLSNTEINNWSIGFLDEGFILGTYGSGGNQVSSYGYQNLISSGVSQDIVPTTYYNGDKYSYVPYPGINGFPVYDFISGGFPLIYTDKETGYSYYTREGVLYTNKVGSLGGSIEGGDNGDDTGNTFDYTNSQSNNNNTNSWGNVPSKTGIVGESIDYVTSYEQQSNLHSNEAKGDPVNLSKGEFTYDNTLMQYSSKGFPFEFKINYLSQGYYNGPIGNNFDYNYNQFLREGNSGTIYYYNGSLGVFEFAKTADGYEFNKAIKGELTETDGVFTLKLNNTKTLTFAENKRLASISDNFGNTETFAYTGSGQLTKITDTNSREYNLSYHDHTRLKDITDFTGNKVEFIYFGSGETDGSEYDLKTIKMINGAETREISFTYTIADTFENSHNIIKLIDSENNIYVENAYDTNDRVTSQMYGTGTINYTYVLSEDGKIILENHVTDREQNQTTYKYDTNGNVIQKVVGTKIYNYTYNDNNYLSKEINPLGNGYTYLYDTNNNLTEKRFKTDVNAENSEADLVTSFTYDQATNKPLTITMPNGLKTVLVYDTNGNLTNKKTYDSENTLLTEESYEYNTVGELVKKIDKVNCEARESTLGCPKLNETSFEYTNGNLTKIIKGTGTGAISTQYNYDTKGNITSIIDGEGNETSMTYDDFNLLNKITTPESIVSEYTYNNLNKKTNEKIILSDTESVDTAYTYDILDNPTLITTDLSNTKTKTVVTAYDKNSNITETKVGSLATNKFEYDAEGNITKKTTISATLGSIVTTYEYDENNRLKKVIAPNNTEIVYSYNLHDQITKITDSNGTYSKLEYNKAGNITKREVYNSADTLLQRETYSYDSLGREIETKAYDIQNNKEIITSKEYDKNNNITKTRDAKQNETNYSYDQFDRLIEVTDSLGNKVQNTYNKNNKVVETKVIGVNGKTITTNYEYDSDNRLTKKTDSLGNFESYTYNKLNQIIEKKDKKLVSTYYTYDYVGNVLTETTGTKTISYEYNDNSKLTKVIDANNNITNYDYDDLGNLTKITYPDQNHMTYEYDKLGNLTKKTDPNGTIVTNTYDSQNRLTHRSIQTGSGVLGVTSENYTYDALGRLLTATDSEGNDLSFAYDSLSRLTSETNSNKTVNYTYDDNGNNTSINDINYTYDTLNRLESVKKGTESIANYNYDSLNLLSQTLGNGVQTNYTYDTLNRLETLNSNTYTYDPNSNITSNGLDSYTYDNLNQLTKANYNEKLVNKNSNTYQYDLMGNRKYETQTRINKNGNPVNKVFAYTKNNLNQYQDRLVYTGATTDTEVIPETNTGTIEEDLTETGEIEILNTEILPETETNTGETTEEEITTPEEIVDLQGRLLYDKNGNMIGNMLNNKRQYIYSYDYKNRLVKIEKTIYKKVNGTETNEVEQITRIIEYKYDVLGRRIKKINNNLTYTKFYYSNQNLIQEEYYTKTNILKNQKNYIYSNQTDDVLRVENIDYKTRKIQEEYVNNKGVTKIRTIREEYTETNIYYYEKDEKGSITKITDKDGTIVEQYLYDAYGTPYTKTQSGELITISNLKPSLIGNTRLYTGREYDRGLQLYYNRARYYNPQLGRFISRDPIDISDDVNLYTYVGNNPVMFVDRMGLEKAVLSIYAEKDNGGISEGHAWIEIYYKGNTTTYGLYPKGKSYAIGETIYGNLIIKNTIEGVNTNVEYYKKDISYNNYTSFSVNISESKYKDLLKSINNDINKGVVWGIGYSDYGVCSKWASDKWNEVVSSDLNLQDRNIIGISNPNTLANSIENLLNNKK